MSCHFQYNYLKENINTCILLNGAKILFEIYIHVRGLNRRQIGRRHPENVAKQQPSMFCATIK